MNEEEILFFNWIWFCIRMQKIWFLSSKSLKRAISPKSTVSFLKEGDFASTPNVKCWLEGRY